MFTYDEGYERDAHGNWVPSQELTEHLKRRDKVLKHMKDHQSPEIITEQIEAYRKSTRRRAWLMRIAAGLIVVIILVVMSLSFLEGW